MRRAPTVESMTAATDTAVASRWRASPAQLLRLLPGLWLFGTGDAFIVAADLGNGPWTVFAQGVALHTPLTIGIATQLIGVVVLLGWLALRERPGIGTIGNIIVIGFAIDVMLTVLPDPQLLALRWAYVLFGIALVGVGSGLYLTADLGPGPRDGLMTGLHQRFGWSLSSVRLGIELAVLAAGAALGGVVGLGTVLYALLIGLAVGAAVRALGARPTRAVPAGAPRA